MKSITLPDLSLPIEVTHDSKQYVFFSPLERVALEAIQEGKDVIEVVVLTSKPVFRSNMAQDKREILDRYYYILK